MTPAHWLAVALGLLVVLATAGAVIGAALEQRRDRRAERPLGWDAAMAELEVPELPVDRYSLDALTAEMEASTEAMNRLAEWLKVEPRDKEAKARLERMTPRHMELLAEVKRRKAQLSDRLIAETVNEWRRTARLRQKIDEMDAPPKVDTRPPGPHDDVTEIREWGGRAVYSHVERCVCRECVSRRGRRIPPPNPRGGSR